MTERKAKEDLQESLAYAEEGFATPEPSDSDDSNDARQLDLIKCVVCYDRRVRCTAFPCGHLCLCVQCVHDSGAMLAQCPMCRKGVISWFRTRLP
jgi:hypothetical protein